MENSYILSKIDCPPDWQSLNDYDSHRPLLHFVIDNLMPVNIVEFGCGFGSTPLFERWQEIGGIFTSYETNKEWADKFPDTLHVEKYGDLMMMGVDMLFIDCAVW